MNPENDELEDYSAEDMPFAIEYAKEHDVGPNDSIVAKFTPDMKLALLSMIRKGEFTKLEGALLKVLMSEELTDEQLGVVLGTTSTKTKGKPMSKQSAKCIMIQVVGELASKFKKRYGITIDQDRLMNLGKEQRRLEREKAQRLSAKLRADKERQRELRIRGAEAEKEFYKLLRELRQAQAEYNLPRSEYYIRYKAPKDVNIDTMKQFGGEYQDND